MKHLITAVVSAALLFGTASGALADVFAIQADVPFQIDYAASELSADSVEGYIIGVTLPFFLGIALEDYEVSGKIDVGTSKEDFTQAVTFTDIYLSIPFPLVNLGIGYGVGTAKLELKDSTVGLDFDDAALTQYFVTAGWPIAVLFDVHLGYRVISGTADVASGGTGDADLNANLLSLGVKVGF